MFYYLCYLYGSVTLFSRCAVSGSHGEVFGGSHVSTDAIPPQGGDSRLHCAAWREFTVESIKSILLKSKLNSHRKF